MTNDNTRRALGRGLGALLPPRPAPATGGTAVATPPAAPVAPTTAVPRETAAAPPVPTGEPLQVAIALIDANPLQPRTVFQPERIAELAESIKANGIIQPLVVRKKDNGRYELIAGERRLRASKLAGLDKVPVVVQAYVDNRVLEVSLIENIQREDLNPMEVAHAFDRLHRELDLTHEQIANRTGKERTTVTNMIRLLRLPGPVQLLLAEQKLSMGHARALLALPQPEDQTKLAEQVAKEGMSVRTVEKTVAKLTEPPVEKEAKPEKKIDPNVKAAIDDLERHLGTRVKIVETSGKRGRIEVEYYSMDDLDRIYGLLLGDKG